jgi:hypothetical protein
MDDGTKKKVMTEIERFVEENGLRVEGEDGKFTESWEMTRQNGPHQIPTFTLIDLLERKWIDIDTIKVGVEFSNWVCCKQGAAYEQRPGTFLGRRAIPCTGPN